MNNLIKSTLVAAGLFSLAAPASAAILDGWQIDTTSVGGVLTKNIGNIVLGGGLATVNQQINALGQVYVGARFSEFGAIYSLSYVKENVVGSGDFGAQNIFGIVGGQVIQYQFEFSGLGGYVTNVGAGGSINYVFDSLSSSGSIKLNLSTDGGSTFTTVLSSFKKPTGGGSLNDFAGGAGTNGDSSLNTIVTNAAGDVPVAGLFRNSAGTALDDQILLDQLLFFVRTNNKIQDPFVGPVLCDVDNNANTQEFCAVGRVTSEGSGNLAIPEPATLALLGAGFAGLGFFGRRNKKQA